MQRLGRDRLIGDNKGIIVLFIAVAAIALFGFVGLAIDVGYIYMVKAQLENAADAGALAGAEKLYPTNVSPSLPAFPTTPDFSTAEISARAFVKENTVNGVKLTDGDEITIEKGYWNLSQVPAGLQLNMSMIPQGKCSASGAVCTSSNADTVCGLTQACMIQDIPGVQVTVQKAVPTFFARILGFDTFTPKATAVAAIGFPQSAKGLFPLAVTKCMVDSYFGQSVIPTPASSIQIFGPYGPGGSGCNTGQWTSLTSGKNDVPTMEGLMYGTVPLAALTIGDIIEIDPGAKQRLFQDIQNDFLGRVVELPVVGDAGLTNGSANVTGFVYFQIDNVIGTSNILGHFLAYYTEANGNRPGGPKYNSVTKPILVK